MVGELIADRYELEELVGTGGMSSVFKAHDRLLERSVALKILHEHYTDDPDYVERFRREARAVAQLAHPNIVTVIDRGEQGGRQFIVFEYVDGENLKRIVDRNGPLSIREGVELALQVGRALDFAHERGIVHRDVKPQNVLLNEDGRAKVTDFGIARTLDVDGVTQTGTVLGTSDYIAPEQAQGQVVEPRTDLYSLGIVLFELLTGELPYEGESFVSVALRHVNDPVPSVRDRRPDCPPRLDAAIRRAMAKRADDRWPSMAHFVAELEACLAEEDGYTEGATMVVPARLRRPGRGRRALRRFTIALVLLALAALVGVGAFALLASDDGDQPDAAGAAGPVKLRGADAYDPEGGDGEHGDRADDATDGDPATYWPTETYNAGLQGAGKSGVGLLLDAGRRAQPNRLRVQTDTPGFVAEIRAGDSPAGPFRPVSRSQTMAASTTFTVEASPKRYYVVWITDLGPNSTAHVNEARAG